MKQTQVARTTKSNAQKQREAVKAYEATKRTEDAIDASEDACCVLDDIDCCLAEYEEEAKTIDLDPEPQRADYYNVEALDTWYNEYPLTPQQEAAGEAEHSKYREWIAAKTAWNTRHGIYECVC